jgi:hypothetical protein
MDHYTIVLQTATDDPDTLVIDHLDIRSGRYKATFSFLGLAEQGYMAVQWGGITNHFDNLSDGAIIAASFADDTQRVYTGEIYVSNPGERLQCTFQRQADYSIIEGPLPTVRVNLERLA